MAESAVSEAEVEYALALRPTKTAPRAARMLVTGALDLWGLDELIDDGMLIVSELVTNAARYANEMVLHLFVDEGDAVIEVWDDSEKEPLAKDSTLEEVSGRGLFLVDAYSSSWGWIKLREGGKVVWARLTPHKENE